MLRRTFPTNRRSISGFTLIELMVVVAIIALLISIALPALKDAKAQSEQTACGGKIHGFEVALGSYFADFNDTFPLNGTIMPKSQIPTIYANNAFYKNAEVPVLPSDSNPLYPNQKWRPEYGALWTYMGGIAPTVDANVTPLPAPTEIMLKAYVCQTDIVLDRMRDLPNNSNNISNTPAEGPLTMQTAPNGTSTVQVGDGVPGYWSYSINAVTNSLGRFRNNAAFANGVPWGDPLRMTNVRDTSNFILFVEEAHDSKFNDEVFEPPAYNNTTDGSDLLSDRHNFGGNVGMGDSSVEYFKAVVFNNGPAALSGSQVDNTVAMQYPVTRMFFPDFGDWAY